MAFFIFDDEAQQVFQEIAINSRNVNEQYYTRLMKSNLDLFSFTFEGKDRRSFSRDVGHETNIVSRYIDGCSIAIYDSGLKVSILDEHLA